jgi:hypothetical protein
VGVVLQLVRQRCQERCLAAGAVCDRLPEQPVGEPRVAGEERAVQIGPDRAADATALRAARAVVAEARHDATERLGARVQRRSPRMVLEAGNRPALAGNELGIEQDIADHPTLACNRVQREQADAGQLLAVPEAVEAAQQLVAAADGEHRSAARRGREQPLALVFEVARDERLLAVLAAADVEEVVRAGLQDVVRRNGLHLELVPAPRGAALEHGDVPAVGVDVQVLGIEVPDDDLHAATQYCGTWPRWATMRRSASIAV